jgi:hypothetical protein
MAGLTPNSWGSLKEHNSCHLPAGSEAGGQFGRKGQCIQAYHGSPYIFDQFVADKVGTGEGAQAFGWGLYFATDMDVARGYRRNLTTTIPGNYEGRSKYGVKGAPEFPRGRSGHAALDTAMDIEMMLGDRKLGGGLHTYLVEKIDARIKYWLESPNGGSAGSDMRELVDYYLAHARNATPDKIIATKGALYTVEIDSNLDSDFLDWDAPLSSQTQSVKDFVRSFDDPGHKDYSLSFSRDLRNAVTDLKRQAHGNKITGAHLYKAVEQVYSQHPHVVALNQRGITAQRAASDLLASMGLAGIKYFDGKSRDFGAGSRNLVVFDPKRVRVTRRVTESLWPD